MASPIQIPSGMNDALWPLRTNVVSANAARPRGAGSATGQKAGNSRSVVTAMGATSFVPLLAVAPAGAFQIGFPCAARPNPASLAAPRGVRSRRRPDALGPEGERNDRPGRRTGQVIDRPLVCGPAGTA